MKVKIELIVNCFKLFTLLQTNPISILYNSKNEQINNDNNEINKTASIKKIIPLKLYIRLLNYLLYLITSIA